MADYISCVEASGGNHDTISLEISNAQSGKASAGATGSGSGVVVKGSGSLALNRATEEALAKKFEEKWGTKGMEECRKVLDPPRAPKPSSAPAPKGPRLATGPEAYKNLTDEQVGQWGIEEAAKLEDLAEEYELKADTAIQQGGNGNAQRFFFTNDFNRCCAQDLRDLRAELFSRLGPPAKSASEEQQWDHLWNSGAAYQIIHPALVKDYTPYLRLLGLKLKRRSIPRNPPRQLHFSESAVSPEVPGSLPFKIVATIETKDVTSRGYLIVEFDRSFEKAGCDVAGSRLLDLRAEQVDNKELTTYLAQRIDSYYGLVIRKTPLAPNRPIHVEAAGGAPLHVTKVTFFDE